MGQRGPAPKPTNLKLLEGTYRADRASPNEPQPQGDARCPTWLSAEAKAEWRRLAPELRRLGLLTAADQAAFAAYCQTYARWIDAERTVQAEGMTFTTENGYIQQHPAVGIANTALTQMKGYLQQFGLTPASRSRLVAKPAEGPADDPEAFLFGEGTA